MVVVCEVVGDVVYDVVAVEVGLDVGVVTSQPWKPPYANASTIKLRVIAMAWHVSGLATMLLPLHVITASSLAAPPGERRNALTAY